MVARRARLEPPRAGEIGGKRAADGAAPGRVGEQRAVVHRLERELLVAARQQRFDLGNRGSGAR
jgi:hypothetical protein